MNAMSPGQVCWFEFLTADPATIEKFYGQLLGWTVVSGPLSPDLRIYAHSAVLPMGSISETASGGEHLRVGVASADVASDAARLTRLGASIAEPATEDSAVVADPLGHTFTLSSDPLGSIEFPPGRGSMAWFELGTADPRAVESFYTEAFGWRFEFDQNAGKAYYNIFTGPQWPIGGMYDLGPDGPEYFIPCYLVDDVPALGEAAEKLGGAVESGPDGCPDGLMYSRIIDPGGNRFELFSNPGM
ncbi:VOC family protein [Nocardia terpenica]|uniref:VOC domain-containing protein n=1 Tax=Nocardia terpenica TaxID=455432 RepID=A0A161WCR5_9NOCA|nr:VOC family protein [Nocardia terpenica]KZM74739.1 hypothetical protein AWN90_22060 [Nocardia terpenica]MBF6065338.1 VOC family protein [Nocardia terpenica]MBF6108910.1 VOC family protein [Nocardia terpenica]MBF6121753.1 VOC family protein [Nocardia terpenica]NQE93642.1 VOC family protein [Nocardia terpenica]